MTVFFFFKQKTAYEMRISDWSSDVCSSDLVCDIPLVPLAADAPLYDRPYLSREEYKAWAQVKPLGEVPESPDIGADLLKLMASPNLASKRWIYEQYDSQDIGRESCRSRVCQYV